MTPVQNSHLPKHFRRCCLVDWGRKRRLSLVGACCDTRHVNELRLQGQTRGLVQDSLRSRPEYEKNKEKKENKTKTKTNLRLNENN
jgi:hypothetical protein